MDHLAFSVELDWVRGPEIEVIIINKKEKDKSA